MTLAGGGAFSTGAVAITGSWTLVGIIPVGQRKGRVSILLVTAGASLTDLKITDSTAVGGHGTDGTGTNQDDLAVNADFDTPTFEIQSCRPVNPNVVGAGSRIRLNVNCDGPAELAIWAKGNGATITMSGQLPKEF